MGATLEVKYFNTFLLKKLETVVDKNPAIDEPYENVPYDYPADITNDWYIEESRIRGGFNNTTVDFGVKAYLDEEDPLQQHRFNTLIYSGIYNSRTGVNNINQFSVGEDITRSVDPANGSIQKLYAEDTNLIIFQEDKVSKALIDKDAIYSAEGNAAVTSANLVIGQIVPYAGEYGISKDPFSFAVYGYRKYFTDRKRGCVLRLSSAGEIIEISGYGMHDFFRDNLTSTVVNKVVGGWDMHTKNYILSIQKSSGSPDYHTLSFDESVQGWTSFFSYKPDYISSLVSNYYSFYQGKIWQHHTGNYGNFYGSSSNSTVKVILNSQPSLVKNFKTFNYEGDDGWHVTEMVASSGDTIFPIPKYTFQQNLADLQSNIFSTAFKKKENKYFANLINNSAATAGEVVFGQDSSGIKGFFSKVTIELTNADYASTKKELFAVSSDTVESSY